jgi:hypothetical protein
METVSRSSLLLWDRTALKSIRSSQSNGWLSAVQRIAPKWRRGVSRCISALVKRQRVWIFASSHRRNENRCRLYWYTGRYRWCRSCRDCLGRAEAIATAAAVIAAAIAATPRARRWIDIAYQILAAILCHSKNTERIYESSVCICLALARTFNLSATVRAEAGESAETQR